MLFLDDIECQIDELILQSSQRNVTVLLVRASQNTLGWIQQSIEMKKYFLTFRYRNYEGINSFFFRKNNHYYIEVYYLEVNQKMHITQTRSGDLINVIDH